MSDLIRSFIAVNIPAATLRSSDASSLRSTSQAADLLRAAQARLRAADPSVKWVSPDIFHITLKFLGGVAQPRLAALWQSLHQALDGSPSFLLRFRGLGAFPSPKRPRVIWAGITDGAQELTRLAARVEQICTDHGFEPENRPFHAHLTLGRARQPAPAPALAAVMAELSAADLGEARLDRVALMKSELTRSGAIYHILEEKPLG